jgi:hypothetical protein
MNDNDWHIEDEREQVFHYEPSPLEVEAHGLRQENEQLRAENARLRDSILVGSVVMESRLAEIRGLTAELKAANENLDMLLAQRVAEVVDEQ